MSGCDESTWEGALWVSAVDVVSQRRELWEGLCHRCYQFAANVTTSKGILKMNCIITNKKNMIRECNYSI